MANTYKALSTVTVGASGSSSISFSNIPQTYTDLKLVISSRDTSGSVNDYPRISFNGSSSSQQLVALAGNGTGTSTYTDTALYTMSQGDTGTASIYGNAEFYIPNYAGSTNKSLSSDGVNNNNATNSGISIFTGLWSNTSPITSITLTPYDITKTFQQYSTFTLYGIFNADVSSAPATPTIGTASVASATSASVAFTGVSNAASYTATSTPSSITATGTTSPLTVTGLTAGTSYTFKVKSNNPFGSSAESAASNSILLNGYESIATTSVGAGGSSSVSFSSIPTGFTHLQIRAIIRTNRTGYTNDLIRVRFNSDTSTNYDNTYLYGDGSGIATGASINLTNIETWIASTDTALANVFAGFVIDILDVQDTNKWKTISALGGFANNGANGWIVKTTGKRRSTGAISSIALTMNSGTSFNQYSHFALYGIRTA
jgi:hypothetical protein